MKTTRSSFLAAAVLLFTPLLVRAETIVVTTNGDGFGTFTPASGGDPAFATTLRGALDNANSGDVITFDVDVFTTEPTITVTDGVLLPPHGVTILGLGEGVPTLKPSPSGRVFQVNAGITATFEKVKVANGGGNIAQGGGIFNAGTLMLNDCILESNGVGGEDSAVGGGAVFCDVGATLTATGTAFLNNSVNFGTPSMNVAAGGGAAVFAAGNNTLTFTDCAFTNNFALGTASGGRTISLVAGAAIYCSSGTLTMTGCTFGFNQINGFANTGSITAVRGGAIYFGSGTATITRTSFTANASTGTGVGEITGGGLANAASGASVALTECAFVASQSFNGGALHFGADGSTLVAKNCTFASNSGRAGGALEIAAAGADATLIHCTVGGNMGVFAGLGGGIRTAGTLTLLNSILSNNTNNDLVRTGGTVNATATLIKAFTGGSINGTDTGNLPNVDAKFGPLADYGGPVQTRNLTPGSPAINAGVVDASAPALDARGLARVGAPDLGAYEVQGFTVALNAGSGQTAVVGELFAEQLSVLVKDGDAPSAGTVVTFTAPSSGASAQLGGIAAADAQGIFTLPQAIANNTAGTYNVTASVPGGLSTASFSLTNKARPVVVSLNRMGASAFSNAATVHWTLAFDYEVDGLADFNFSLEGAAAGSATIGTPVTNDGGVTWDVPVTTGPDDGDLTLLLTGTANLTPEPSTQTPYPGQTFTMDKTLPVIAPPGGGFNPLKAYVSGTFRDYTSQATVTDTNPGTFTQAPLAANAAPGPQNVTLTATDAAGNQATLQVPVEVVLREIDRDVLFMKNGDAPGRGTNGLPSEAILTSFGVPAIDDLGNVAFTAKWSSDNGKVKGSGLFLDDACLAIVGGDASSIATSAKFKSFGDPVISEGSIAVIAGLTAKATPSVVLSNIAVATTLEAVARVGDVATDKDGAQPLNGAKFKAFKGVSIDGSAVLIFAQLTGGTGAEKATGANDLGLWMKVGAGPLRRVLRENDSVQVQDVPLVTRKIKTLVSFGAGNGSPGAGRGWLAQPYDFMALARVTFDDKSQAVLASSSSGTVQIYSLSGVAGMGGPAISDATFASYSFPATNDGYNVTFLGSMTVGAGGVTKADARGVFVSNGAGAYTALARVGSPAPGTDAKFSVLKDPVLDAGEGVAFPATIKGGTVKGLGMTTLWWRPSMGALTLLAQAGSTTLGVPNDLPDGAQWKSFTSLAIASNRGPLFTGVLVAKKGGVTAATANGVWAMDFTGELRTLFRTGVPNEILANKTLKSVMLLKASVGSMGVTRSFNATQKVAWLATFTDKSQAIVTTEVP